MYPIEGESYMRELGIFYSPDDGGGGTGKDRVSPGPNQVEIGTSLYSYSPRVNDHIFRINLADFDRLWLGVPPEVSICPDYDREKSTLVVREPHFIVSAQFRLYKGLEIFFQENPGLEQKTAFLTEGFPANERVSLQSLIDEEPNPSDELIREVLQSFLINGAMAYEWKHQRGIPIMGIEDPHLYALSRDFALLSSMYGGRSFYKGPLKEMEPILQEDTHAWEVIQKVRSGKETRDALKEFGYILDILPSGEIIWNITYEVIWAEICTARNYEMARTLISNSGSYENPMLFIGSMHLLEQGDFGSKIFKAVLAQLGPNGPFGREGWSRLMNAANRGIYHYLRDQKIGFTFLDPEKLGDQSDYAGYYYHLFATQQGVDRQGMSYEEYINLLLSERGINKKTTVRPSPEGATRLVRALKEKKEEERTSGVVYERKEQEEKRPHWIKVSRDEVWSGVVKDTIWGQPQTYQGRDFEQVRTVNLGSNCPHIDDIVVDAMTATQHKSMDLTAKSYQDPKDVDSKVRGYIDNLDETTKGVWSWTDKDSGAHYDFERGVNFQDRYLELGIPADRATQAQIDRLVELQEYAQTRDVTLVIVEVP